MAKDIVLITGGAGFIGSNAAARFMEKGFRVVIVDNFSRKGSEFNLDWLKTCKGSLKVIKDDVRNNSKELLGQVHTADYILHCAGQVAVTTSVENPREDFEINAYGTLNMLEMARSSNKKPVFLFTSTNKVYGSLENVEVKETPQGYSMPTLPHGVPETQPLDFHSPYGCSKGTADQYVRDYARIYGMKTVVFRQSCIYGPRQFGIEDQGWLAWFMISAMKKNPITIYGDGKQVRDILYIDDLVHAYELAFERGEKIMGGVFNIGGGPTNSISIWNDCKKVIEEQFKTTLIARFEKERAGDQKIFIADIRKAQKILGWTPLVQKEKGMKLLADWIQSHSSFFI